MNPTDNSVADLYGYLHVHRLMLKDTVRTEAFRQAIAQVVKPGDAVLDLGAGTGILSLFAAQAGARQVYAVERTATAALAREIIALNQLSERITVLQQDVREMLLPEMVDVLVFEWMGSYGIDENFLQPFLAARDRWLKPEGRLIPGPVSIYLAPIWDEQLEEELQFWRGHRYGLDLGLVADRTVNEVLGLTSVSQTRLSAQSLRASPHRVWEIDPYAFPEEWAAQPFRSTVAFEFLKPGRINGLALWFTADLAPGLVLTNAPGAPATHWGVARLPLAQAREVRRGSWLVAELTSTPAGPGYAFTEWAVQVDGGPWEHHSDNPARLVPKGNEVPVSNPGVENLEKEVPQPESPALETMAGPTDRL